MQPGFVPYQLQTQRGYLGRALIWSGGGLVALIVFVMIGQVQAATSNFPESDPVVVQPTEVYDADFVVEQVIVLTSADGRTPDNGVFLVLVGTLYNNTSRVVCVRARDSRLYIDDEDYVPANSVMDAVKVELDGMDFMGAYSGHCVDGGTSEPSFIAFDVPVMVDQVDYQFDGRSVSIELVPLQATPTSTPSPTPISTPTQAVTATYIPGSDQAQLATAQRVLDGAFISDPDVVHVDYASAYESVGRWDVTLELVIVPGANTEATATRIRELVVQRLGLTPSFITMTLNDGAGASDYRWDDGEWRVTPLTITPLVNQPEEEDKARDAFTLVFGEREITTLVVNNRVVTLRFPLADMNEGTARLDATDRLVALVCSLRDYGLTERIYQITGTIEVITEIGEIRVAEGVEMILSAESITAIDCDNQADVLLPTIAEQFELSPLLDD